MTPTPQKSPMEIAKETANDIVLKGGAKSRIAEAIVQERTAYNALLEENDRERQRLLNNHISQKRIHEDIIHELKQELSKCKEDYNALLDKVQLIETERDDLKSACDIHKNNNTMLIGLCETLQKRVDSEYNLGIKAAARYVAYYQDCEDAITVEAILKLRRV